MIDILVGLPILFLIVCLFWYMFYFLNNGYFNEPPSIIKIIGIIGWLVIAIGIILFFSWFIGKSILEWLGGKYE